MLLFSLIETVIMHVYVGYIYGAEYKKNEQNWFKYLSYNTTGVSKNYLIFNKLATLIYLIILKYCFFKTNHVTKCCFTYPNIIYFMERT